MVRFSFKTFVLTCLFPLWGQAGLYQELSSFAYRIKNGACANLNADEQTRLSQNLNSCSQNSQKKINQASEDILEHSFFQLAASKQEKLLQCRQDRLSLYHQGVQGLHNIGEEMVDDTYQKLKTLQKIQNEIQNNVQSQCQSELSGRLASSTERYKREKMQECLFMKSNQRFQSKYRQPTENEKQFIKQREELFGAYEAVQSSIWESSDPKMKEWLNQQIKNLPSEDQFKAKAPDELKKVLQKMKDENKTNLDNLKKQKTADTYKLDTGTKEKILHSPQLLSEMQKEVLAQKNSDPAAFDKMMCRLDGKYGKGTDYVDTAIGISSLVFFIPSGGSSTLLSAALIARTGMAGRTALSLGKAFRTTTGGGLALQTAHEVEKACLSKSPTKALTGNSCNSAEYEVSQMYETNCALEVLLQGSPYLAGLGLAIKNNKKTKVLAQAIDLKQKNPNDKRSFTDVVSDAGVNFYNSKSPKPITISNEVLNKSSEKAIQETKKLKVRTQDYHSQTGEDISAIQLSNQTYKLSQNSGQFSKLKEVVELPKNKGPASPDTPALIHPDMETYLKKAQAMGVKIIIDPTLALTKNILAAYRFQSKTIHIRPDSSFQTFVHEFEHAHFEEVIGRQSRILREDIQSGKSLSEVLPPAIQKELGKEKVEKLETLVKSGYNDRAIHETFAVDAELKTLGFQHVINGTKSKTETYKHYHQIDSLEDSIKAIQEPRIQVWDYEKLDQIQEKYRNQISQLEKRERELRNQKLESEAQQVRQQQDQLRHQQQDEVAKMISNANSPNLADKEKLKILQEELELARKRMRNDFLLSYGAEVTQKALQRGVRIDAVINNIEPTVEKIYRDKNGNLYIQHKDKHWEVIKLKKD